MLGKIDVKKFHLPIPSLWEIQHRRKEARERRERQKLRRTKPDQEIRYLDRVVLLDGCRYEVNGKSFDSMEKALRYCKKRPAEWWQKRRGAGIDIRIKNPLAPELIEKSMFPKHLLMKDTKDVLCRFARERTLLLAEDLSEVYTESFELWTDKYGGCSNIFDYGLLYGNHPIYDGQICISRYVPWYSWYRKDFNENTPFVAEYAAAEPNQEYRFFRDVHLAYDCYTVSFDSDGTVDDDANGAFPFRAIPVSTFVNIGMAGVYHPIWEEFFNIADTFEACGKSYNLLRFAILACKQSELPEGEAHYTIAACPKNADGLLPEELLPLGLRESCEKLAPHAKKRVFSISPQFDAIYWESFELTDSAGTVHRFRYDHGLLKTGNRPEGTCRTTYWQKARWAGLSGETAVQLEPTPDGDALYHGIGNLEYVCWGWADGTHVCVPAETLEQ